ncbi:2,3-diaminopropionate biosynthesis protein SbnB [Streptomyces sp. NPDC091268]|uniref:2,3-diaminopropionate biosynthesis protein SbnB n=1 Tax=Streptomyces sp. NPDC091268 TaxID=3365979 RepID=UPI0037FEF194
MLIIGHREVRDILKGKEPEVLEVLADAHRRRCEGAPGPSGSIDPGGVRAGAGIVLRSPADGAPEAFLEASLILAKRLGGSAGLAAGLLCAEARPRGLALVGLGPVALEVLRFVKARFHSLIELTVFDPDTERTISFAREARRIVPGAAVHYADSAEDALAAHTLVSLAAPPGTPLLGLERARPGAVVLHVSGCGLTADALLGARTVVDVTDRACGDGASPHLAELTTDRRDVPGTPIGALVRDPETLRPDPDRVTVYTPSGPAAPDLALARWVTDQARRWRIGVRIDDFLPATPTAPAVPVTTSS